MREALRNNNEVAHVWANQSQARGHGSHFFFDGPSIFSYGRHFEIARHVSGVVLFTTDDYSVTTARHKTIAIRAVNHKKVFFVPSFTDHNQNADHYVKLCASQTEKGKRARENKKYYFQDVVRWSNEAREYVEHFKSEITKERRKAIRSLPDDVFDILNAKEWAHEADLAQGRALREEANRLKCAARYAIIEQRRKEETQALNVWGEEIQDLTAKAWKAGLDLPRDFYYNDSLPTLLRVKGNDIETTRGAYVSIEEARTLWGMMKRGESIQGFKISGYEVSGVHDGKLIIGCHRIPMREVARMAVTLGLESEAA